MNKRGYLIFNAEGGDEIHASFLESAPKTDKLFSELLLIEDDYEIGEKYFSYINDNPDVTEPWFTQTRCNEPWPFNNYTILNTYCIALS